MFQRDTEKQIFFHVGLHKTASTFLQQNVFPNFYGITYIDKKDFEIKDSIIKETNCRNILLSRETYPEEKSGLRRIKDVARKYPTTIPVLVLREHGQWVVSRYKHYLKYGHRDFDEFFDLKCDQGIIKKHNLEYMKKIELLKRCFQNPPYVIFHEELINNLFGVIDELSDLLGITYAAKDISTRKANQSYSEKQLQVMKNINKKCDHNINHKTYSNPDLFCKIFSKLFSRTGAYLVSIDEFFSQNGQKLVNKDAIEAINKLYRQDWWRCLDYARSTRNKVWIKEVGGSTDH